MTDRRDEEIVRVRVWSVPVRLFHWLLVAAVATAWILGEFGPSIKTNHFYAGYAVGGLVVLRLLWGLFGPRVERFSGFVAGPRRTLSYMAGMFSRSPSGWYGHNPVGGWSVVAILLALLLQVATGLVADDEIFNKGPFADLVGTDLSLQATALHHLLSKVVLALVVIHVAAVAFYAIWKRENLVHPMITGWKKVRRSALPQDSGRTD
ncbi:MAG: cytochrome B [Rhizobiales bacterium]|nr:cytochrome B [Hyphomicrobiales bacterium]